MLLALASAACLAYPHVSNWWYRQAQEAVIYSQAEAVEAVPAEDLASYWEAARAYNERIRGGMARVEDPFNPDSVSNAGAQEYWRLLNVNGDGVMGAIHLPRLGIQAPIFHGTDERTLEEGVGHVENTALPVGGESTHAVLAGHSGLPSVQIFDALEECEVGDYLIIQVLDGELAYRVHAIDVVLPHETGSLAVQPGRDLVTLVTCTPYGINDHRLLVHAERCEVPPEWREREAGGENGLLALPDGPSLLLFAGVGAALATIILIAFVLRRTILSRCAGTPPPVSS